MFIRKYSDKRINTLFLKIYFNLVQALPAFVFYGRSAKIRKSGLKMKTAI